MKRPPIATGCSPFILSGIAMVLCALSSPIGTSQSPDAHGNPNSLVQESALTADGSRVPLWSATPSGVFVDTCHSAILEAGEGKPPGSLPNLAFLEPDGPPRPYTGPRRLPDDSPLRIVSLPLRC